MRLRIGVVALAALAVAVGCAKEFFFGAGTLVVVRVSPDTLRLQVGEVRRVTGTALDGSNSALFGHEVTWSIGDPDVATVNDTGAVQGVTLGSTIVTARIEGITGTATVVVEPPPAIALSASAVQFDGTVGESDPPPATVDVTNGAGGDLTQLAVGTITYSPGAADWLTATLGGSTAPATLTFTAATALLTTPDTHSATVPIVSDVATNSPQTVTVTLAMAPGTPAALAIVAGDNQIAIAGAPVPVEPSVIVRDGFGNPRPGVNVTFAVTGGGGSVTGAMTTTDPNGIATVGSWTVQSDPSSPVTGQYPNTLSATAEGVGSRTFTAQAVYSFAAHVQPIFSASCAFGGPCHGAAQPPLLTPGNSYAQLVNQLSTCGSGRDRVEPGNSDASDLMLLMDGVVSGACARPMPPSGPRADSLRNVVRSWIRNNAQNN